MPYADPSTLVTIVKKIVGASPLAPKFNGVEIQASDYDDDSEFIRVLVHLKSLDDVSGDDVDMLNSSIEGAFVNHDDRFPSVRFSEP